MITCSPLKMYLSSYPDIASVFSTLNLQTLNQFNDETVFWQIWTIKINNQNKQQSDKKDSAKGSNKLFLLYLHKAVMRFRERCF